MPFNKSKLQTDIKNALAIPVPDGDDGAMATVDEIAGGLAQAVADNPGAMVVDHSDRIKILEDDLRSLQTKVDELQSFVDSIEQRVTAEEEVTSKLKPTALG